MRVSEVSVHRGWTLRIAYTPQSTKPQPAARHPWTQTHRRARRQTPPRGGGLGRGPWEPPERARGRRQQRGPGVGPAPCSALCF